ncbi:MAG: hypothetical protein FJX56_13910 [Alphaproteobacteria bacterium]|nr:hypothetical protein [Alphaproteobacteria bacterium]
MADARAAAVGVPESDSVLHLKRTFAAPFAGPLGGGAVIVKAIEAQRRFALEEAAAIATKFAARMDRDGVKSE